MSLRIDNISETERPNQYRVEFIDDRANRTALICELVYFDGIGWGMNPVTKTDIFWRSNGADSREVVTALVAFREQRRQS